MLPLTVPLFIITALVARPNGVPALIFSLFPLTSPTVMMLRMTLTPVPIWQLLLALLLLGVAALLVIRVVARMFRAQTLLSGQPFQLKQFFHALAGKG
jgi:ABC-2 type transport system permease protein